VNLSLKRDETIIQNHHRQTPPLLKWWDLASTKMQHSALQQQVLGIDLVDDFEGSVRVFRPHRRALKIVHPLHPLEHAGEYYTYGVLLAESRIFRAPASEDRGTSSFSLFDALDRNTLQVSSSVRGVMRYAA